jgi:hypothetical protein
MARAISEDGHHAPVLSDPIYRTGERRVPALAVSHWTRKPRCPSTRSLNEVNEVNEVNEANEAIAEVLSGQSPARLVSEFATVPAAVAIPGGI